MAYYLSRKKKKKPEDGKKKKREPNYVAKLDKVFSEFIRLRDSKAYGFKYFKCISCGRVLPYEQCDCGHFHSRRHMATRFDEDNCHAECRHCLTPDALVLTKDLRWVQLGEVKVGDELFAFDEEEIKYKTSRRYSLAKVLRVERAIEDVYEVELENGDKIKTTANHKWLVRYKKGAGYAWCETQNLWINGVNLHGNRKTGPHTQNVTSCVCKPFLVVDINKNGKLGSRYDTRAKAIRYVGKREIVDMETDTHTFIANGYAMHNCNRFSADHLIGYQSNLIRKIGQKRYDLLRIRAHSSKHWYSFELEELIVYYKALIEALKSGKL